MKKLTLKKMSIVLAAVIVMILAFSVVSFAAGSDDSATVSTEVAQVEADATVDSSKAIGSGIGIGVAAGLGALAMGIAVGRASEGISRQPEAASKIQTAMMLGLVFIETAIIYALIIAILIIFVL